MRPEPAILFGATAAIVIVFSTAILFSLRQQAKIQRARDREIQRQASALRDELAGQHEETSQLRDHLDAVLAWIGLPPMPAPKRSTAPEPPTPGTRHLHVIRGGGVGMVFLGLGAWLLRGWALHPVSMAGASTVTAASAVLALAFSVHPGPDQAATAAGPAQVTTVTSIVTHTLPASKTTHAATAPARPASALQAVDLPQQAVSVPARRTHVNTTALTRVAGSPPSATTVPAASSPRSSTPIGTAQNPAASASPTCHLAASVLGIDVSALCS